MSHSDSVNHSVIHIKFISDKNKCSNKFIIVIMKMKWMMIWRCTMHSAHSLTHSDWVSEWVTVSDTDSEWPSHTHSHSHSHSVWESHSQSQSDSQSISLWSNNYKCNRQLNGRIVNDSTNHDSVTHRFDVSLSVWIADQDAHTHTDCNYFCSWGAVNASHCPPHTHTVK